MSLSLSAPETVPPQKTLSQLRFSQDTSSFLWYRLFNLLETRRHLFSPSYGVPRNLWKFQWFWDSTLIAPQPWHGIQETRNAPVEGRGNAERIGGLSADEARRGGYLVSGGKCQGPWNSAVGTSTLVQKTCEISHIARESSAGHPGTAWAMPPQRSACQEWAIPPGVWVPFPLSPGILHPEKKGRERRQKQRVLCEIQAFSVFVSLHFSNWPLKTTLIFPFQSFSYLFITKIQLFLNLHWEREELVGSKMTQ